MDRISRILNDVVKHMAGFLMGFMAILVFLQVLFRYVLDAPLDWSEEISTFAFAWMALLGASVGLRHDEHPRLDVFFVLFPEKMKKLTRLLVNLAVMFMLGVLFLYGLDLTLTMKMQKTAALGYSVSFVYMVLPLAAAVMLVHVVAQTIPLFRQSSEE